MLLKDWLIDFGRRVIKVQQAETQDTKFDSQGKIIERKTIVGTTKTTCSVREVSMTDMVYNELIAWKEKQHRHAVDVGIDLTNSKMYVFANDDGTIRTYSGCRMIFNRFIKRNHLDGLNVHFHGLRHTFSNMMFELNENPKVIQQLLGHRDVKTTITVYNSVNSDYVREATDRLNLKIQEHNTSQESEEQEKAYGKNPTLTEIEYTPNVEIPTPQNVEEVNEYPTVNEMPNQEDDEDELTDEEIDRMIRALERKKKRKEKDFEM